MGPPRSHERGNDTPHRTVLWVMLLQWGRVLMNAETERFRCPRRSRLGFSGKPGTVHTLSC